METFWGSGNALYLDCGDGYQGIEHWAKLIELYTQNLYVEIMPCLKKMSIEEEEKVGLRLGDLG